MAVRIALCVAFISSSSPAQPLISFSIEDQFGRRYTEKTWSTKILLVFASDRDGSQYNNLWAGAISDSLEQDQRTSVAFAGVSNLGSVPFFLKGYVRGKFPKDTSERVLMDWEGVFAEAYQLEDGVCNILLFDRAGMLSARAAVTQFDPKEYDRIMRGLRSLLDSD